LAEAVAGAKGWGCDVTQAEASEFDRLAPAKTLLASLGLNGRRRDRPNQQADLVDRTLWLLDLVRGELEERCHRLPLMIMADDVQWADPDTLLLLNVLPGQLTGRPIAWVVAYRKAAAPPVVERVIANMVSATAMNVVLRPLDETAVACIIADITGAMPDGRLTGACSGARGNPFLLVELLRSLMAEQLVRVRDGTARLVGSGGLPARFRGTVHTRLEQVPPATRHLLDVASVLGNVFLAEDAASLVGKSPGSLRPTSQHNFPPMTPTQDWLAYDTHR
jgi:predicted ATPase